MPVANGKEISAAPTSTIANGANAPLARARDRKLAEPATLTATSERPSRRGRRESRNPPSSAQTSSSAASRSVALALALSPPPDCPATVVSFGLAAPTTSPLTDVPPSVPVALCCLAAAFLAALPCFALALLAGAGLALACL